MPFVSISQRLGSQGEAIARRVAFSLNLELFDDEKLQQIAIDMGISPEILSEGRI